MQNFGLPLEKCPVRTSTSKCLRPWQWIHEDNVTYHLAGMINNFIHACLYLAFAFTITITTVKMLHYKKTIPFRLVAWRHGNKIDSEFQHEESIGRTTRNSREHDAYTYQRFSWVLNRGKMKKITVLSKWSFVTVYSKAAVYKCKPAVYTCKVLNSRFTTVLLRTLLHTVEVTPFFQIFCV